MDGGQPSNLVYVAGNIGAGKSTTSTRLASALGGRLITEQTETNPYLPAFYGDMRRWTFHVDVHFLAERVATVGQEYHPGGPTTVFDRCYLEGRSSLRWLMPVAWPRMTSGRRSACCWALSTRCYPLRLRSSISGPNLINYWSG